MGCPQCGSEILSSVAVHYQEEVVKPGADPMELDPFAPPTERAKIHLFILCVLAWISMLAPAFAPEGHLLRTSVPFWVLTLVWVPIWMRSRKADAANLSVYRARRYCDRCGWHED
jgi:hypothetical protein